MTSAAQTTPKRAPLKLFFCYAREDAAWRRRLDEHLELVRREGLITTWYDQRIAPGAEWSAVIQENLFGADVVVFLVSPAFLESEYIADVEMQLTLERLGRDGDGLEVHKLERSFRDGTAELLFGSLDLLARFTAHVPRLRSSSSARVVGPRNGRRSASRG